MPSSKVNFSVTNEVGTGIASAAQACTIRPTMKGPHIADRRTLSRRTFLRGAGVAMALPLLESMTPVFARTRQPETPRRMLAVCNNLGLLPDRFFPKNSGRDYELSPYLNAVSYTHLTLPTKA